MDNSEFSTERLITTISVMVFTLVVIFLFLINKSKWIAEANALKQRYDSLALVQTSSQRQVREALRYDSLQKQFFRSNQYDPLVSNGFRIYGLFKDMDNVYTISEIARKFNISNPKSIKVSEADGQNWYIVPVKGIHMVRNKETVANIARYYYRNLADSVLIKAFNPVIRSGQVIFIPFDKP
ncbi:MAG: hypothetical protein RMJ87_00930 [Cytophagales bacterium]|nr:hypothetical protein [Bernardetiaceae bacterium]MDW8203564.1 hypothetical protein [Cytophagales bacterium]